jgi:autophagy-related protein 11
MNKAVSDRFGEIDVMIKCMDAAVANIEISVKQLEPKYTELKKWVEPALEEHDRLANNWQQYLSLARNTTVDQEIVRFMTRGQVDKGAPSLEDLIELETAKKAGKLAATAKRRFGDKAASFDNLANKMYAALDELIADFDKLMGRSVLSHSQDSHQLITDIETIVKQVEADYRVALGYGNTQRDVAQASKTASNHTERLVPNLKKRAKEMDDLVQYATQARNTIATEAVVFMGKITDITSFRSSVKDQINILNQSEDDMTTFDYLRLIQQLPYMYASFLAEAIRRRQWNEKIKVDSSTLANEMALFQDEESKRRRKWQKMVGSTYGPGLDTNVMGLEVSLMGDDSPWPAVSKDDLDNFLEALRGQETEEPVLDDIAQLIQELNAPTKQQSKRLKAFKNGSVHEAALGRSGLMIRGDDDLLRTLQDDKTKLESKVKTAESRVRRLEDLLHRQSQASRPGNLFQPQSQPAHERKDSTSSIRSNRPDEHRRSSDGADPLLRRIAQLENELRDEKQRSSRIQQDLSTRATQHNDMKDQIQEVNSTKKDLLENMEALKREFVEERKSLEEEIKALKARLEDTEDEIEQFQESRHKEKTTTTERVQELEADIERLNKAHNDESLKINGQVDFLRNENRIQREQREALERQIEIAQEENRNISKKHLNAQETLNSQYEALRKLHSALAPQVAVPADVDLADFVQTHTADLLAKFQNMESALALARSDLDRALSSAKEAREEIVDTQSKLAAEEASTIHLREELSKEKAKVGALEHELGETREDLSSLRSKLSDGATGSETLQKKLEDEETKVIRLTEEVASRQSQVGAMEEELHMYKDRLESLHSKLSGVTSHQQGRKERSIDLTQRIYSQNDRMCHLLERIGYSVDRKDGEITINKIPRTERTSQNPNDSSDPGSSLRKSSIVGGKTLHESGELDLLYWTNEADASAEAQNYETFINRLGAFNMELFSDTIYHRIKEVEHKARKWQREARSYRDRAHVMQKDSQEKIAFKHFKEGDLALFLPTRNQQAGAWAAFNVGFPHYFLREQDSHRLRQREWLVARITRIQERVVDLSKSMQPSNEADSINDEENDNPFQLSDGLRWYLIDAHEYKPGAPATPGMGKSTVAANTVEATANIHTHTTPGKGKSRDNSLGIEGINKTLSKSLESRRSSSSSKRAQPLGAAGAQALLRSNALASETNSLRATTSETPAGTSPAGAGPLSSGEAGKHLATEAAGRRSSGQDAAGKAQASDDNSPKNGNAPDLSNTARYTEVRNVDSLLGP